MLKKLISTIAGLLMTISLAFAQVDVNKADQATLDSVKGIGPKISQTIIDERTKNGKFKDWADFEDRVKGIGDKNAVKMSEAGLTVNGQSKSGAAARTDAKTTASTANADRKVSAKTDKAQTAPSSSGASATSDAKPTASTAKADKKVSAKADKAQTAPSSSGASATSDAKTDVKVDAKTDAKTGAKTDAKTDAKAPDAKARKKSSSAPAASAAGAATPAK